MLRNYQIVMDHRVTSGFEISRQLVTNFPELRCLLVGTTLSINKAFREKSFSVKKIFAAWFAQKSKNAKTCFLRVFHFFQARISHTQYVSLLWWFPESFYQGCQLCLFYFKIRIFFVLKNWYIKFKIAIFWRIAKWH